MVKYLKDGQDFHQDSAAFTKDFGFTGSAQGRHDPRNHPQPKNEEYGDGLAKGGQPKKHFADGGKMARYEERGGDNWSRVQQTNGDGSPYEGDQQGANIPLPIARRMRGDTTPGRPSASDSYDLREREDVQPAPLNDSHLARGGKVKKHFDQGGPYSSAPQQPQMPQMQQSAMQTAQALVQSGAAPNIQAAMGMVQSMQQSGQQGGQPVQGLAMGGQLAPPPSPMAGRSNPMMGGAPMRHAMAPPPAHHPAMPPSPMSTGVPPAMAKGGGVKHFAEGGQNGTQGPDNIPGTRNPDPALPGGNPMGAEPSIPMHVAVNAAAGAAKLGAARGALSVAARRPDTQMARPEQLPGPTRLPNIPNPNVARPSGIGGGGMAKGGHMDAKQRNALPNSDFAGPDRSYPVQNENHARSALSRVAQNGSPALQSKVRAKVHSRYPGIGKQKD